MSKIVFESRKFFDFESLRIYLLNRTKIILFGETHGYVRDERDIIRTIIQNIGPEIVLYELLGENELRTDKDKELFLERESEEAFSIPSTYGELQPVIALARNANLPIKGCDLHNLGRDRPVPTDASALTEEDLAYEEELLEKRERKTVEVITRQITENDRILVIVGAYHLRPDSPIVDSFEDSVVITPSYKGEREFEPAEDFDHEEVIYTITTQNELKKIN